MNSSDGLAASQDRVGAARRRSAMTARCACRARPGRTAYAQLAGVIDIHYTPTR